VVTGVELLELTELLLVVSLVEASEAEPVDVPVVVDVAVDA
jgi:hypothetical protein